MKRSMKKTLAIILSLIMISSTFVCFAAELNQNAVNAHYGQYKNYVLLGDSAASGYRDEMSDNDKAFNKANQETVYYRVPGSYADVLANAIIEDKSMTAFAGCGFRTIEIRYMLEDDFAASCDDEYLFHPAQLNAVGYAGSEEWRTAYKNAIAEADLITLGVGGNDWGAYLGWVIADVLEAEHVADQYIKMAEDILADGILDMATVEKLVEVAHLAGALPALLETVLTALPYGLGNFYKNWDIMIQDIYDLNPDVTLMVLGMSDNSLKGNYYDYNGVAGGPVKDPEEEEDPTKAQVMSTIIDFIMTVGNTPMIEGADKFGYIYVDTAGTTYVDSHPDAAGHVFIANKIIEALPDRDIFDKYEDVTPGHKNYKAIEYVLANNIMSATSETTFSPDDALTKGQLAEAFNAITGSDNATDSTKEASTLEVMLAFLRGGAKQGFTGFFKGFVISYKILTGNNFNISASVTRGEVADYIYELCA